MVVLLSLMYCNQNNMCWRYLCAQIKLGAYIANRWHTEKSIGLGFHFFKILLSLVLGQIKDATSYKHKWNISVSPGPIWCRCYVHCVGCANVWSRRRGPLKWYVMQWGWGCQTFRKSHNEGVRFKVIIVTRAWVGVQFPGKKSVK